MQLFYNANIHQCQKEFFFDKNESRHIVKVLRKKEGDLIYLTDGKGLLFHCEIVNASDKKCFVNVKKSIQKERLRNYYLRIAIAPTKLNDRFEWFLEKATEIGVDEITPIICENSERKVVKVERMEKIIQSASKQSLNYYFPKLNNPVKFKDFISTELTGQGFIAHCENDEKKPLQNVWKTGLDTTILIGPEGDFSTDEISNSINNGYQAISLGKSRLRTETAGIVATHSIRFLNHLD